MSLLSVKNLKGACSHPDLLALFNNIKYAHLKNPLLNTEASFFNFTKHSNLFDVEAILGCRLLANFPNHIFFHS